MSTVQDQIDRILEARFAGLNADAPLEARAANTTAGHVRALNNLIESQTPEVIALVDAALELSKDFHAGLRCNSCGTTRQQQPSCAACTWCMSKTEPAHGEA